MTHDPDGNHPEEPEGGPPDAARKLDEDAAWRAIIENYGDRAELTPDDSSPSPPVEPSPAVEPVEPRSVLEPGWRDGLNTEATWDDEGHFVPPDPPPLPPVEPRRKLAWIGLFGGPALMLFRRCPRRPLPRLAHDAAGRRVRRRVRLPRRHDAPDATR